ncbi:MAG TPA: rod shape-determining protein RodA [Coriobacteriia bacterium]
MRAPLSRILRDRVHAGVVLSTVALVVFGGVMVWAATVTMSGHAALVQRQLLGVGIGVIALVLMWVLDYQVLKAWTGPLMVALSLLIISPRIPGLGASVSGATSWLQIGSIRLFQPSEPAKLLFIVVMAAIIAEYGGKLDKTPDILKVVGLASVPLMLILLQPDLGTGMVFVAIASGMLLVGGMRARWFAVFAVAGIVLVLAVFALNSVLVTSMNKPDGVLIKAYQVDRLLVFVDPTRDPKGAGYNLQQSKIAIGSGGLTGAGLGMGSQSRLNFIPERHTDFIFSVLGEQLGFAGAVMLLALYLALMASALSVSASSRDLFGALVAAGLISMWAFQILENMGMTIGMMPITGIPLPFMSYGSSFMVTNLAGVGMLLSIWSRRYGTTTT